MNQQIWDISSVLQWTEDYFRKTNDPQPRLSAQTLISEALHITRMELYCDMHRPLSLNERTLLRGWVMRRAKGEPLQYITGHAPFRHLNLKIKKGVLVPRPETEVLVSEALALLDPPSKPQDRYDEHIAHRIQSSSMISGENIDEKQRAFTDTNDELSSESSLDKSLHETLPQPVGNKQYSALDKENNYLIADICTGSGCIATSLAYEHPSTFVVATDISPFALSLAKENAELYQLQDRIEFIEGNLGDCIDKSLMGSFDIIISNPPYIPSKLINKLPDEVKEYEPLLALDGGDDGLYLFKEIIQWTKKALKKDGSFLIELHEDCLDDAYIYAEQLDFKDIRIIKDLTGANRILAGKKR